MNQEQAWRNKRKHDKTQTKYFRQTAFAQTIRGILQAAQSDVCRRYDMFVYLFDKRAYLSYRVATHFASKHTKRRDKRGAYTLRDTFEYLPFARGNEVLYQLLRARHGRKNAGGDEDGFVQASRKTAVFLLRQHRDGTTDDENDL